MTKPAIAILDDSQSVAMASADWSGVAARAAITVFTAPFADEEGAVAALQGFDVVVLMRERTAFTASLIGQLPRLKMIALTGARAPTLDVAAATQAGILVCNTGGEPVTAATSELAFGLIMACARDIAHADAVMREGGWHHGVPLGTILSGLRLGIVGLGRLGSRVARYGAAFGMEVTAWSQNLTEEKAAEAGARLVSKDELFAASDAISLHLVLSERTKGVVGDKEIAAMKSGAILINTSRGPLIDETPLMAALKERRIRAGLDVFNIEPLPADHGLRKLPNVILTPHLGYSAEPVFRQFYGESAENIVAFLDGAPIRMVNPEVFGKR
ncbi:MAG: D-2-hydroxyacid dehydrogenase family protein [Bosea sp. (in: a-proteobacteria)]